MTRVPLRIRSLMLPNDSLMLTRLACGTSGHLARRVARESAMICLSRRAAPLPSPHIVPMSFGKGGCSSRPLGIRHAISPGEESPVARYAEWTSTTSPTPET
jgi:hypothetical protein